jgi:DNA-binding response OmpR family regulator
MKCKVLIVDDDPFLVLSLKLHFSELGIEVEDAHDGIEALEKVDKFEPDIILSDIIMPRMDGYELHKQLSNNPDMINIPFIFLTAKDDISDQVNGFRMGVDDYICKPFEINDLTQRIQRAIERAEKIRNLGTKADFSGNLSQTAWTDIFQLIELNYKTGELLFLSSEEEQIGKTYFNDGRLVNAQVGHFEGEEAFYALMSLKEGFFEFFSKTIHASSLIKNSNTSILMQGSRMVEEYQDLLQAIPDLNVSIKLTSNKIPMEIKKQIDNQLMLKIFYHIHKKSSVKTILKSGDMSPIRAASILLTLFKNGVLEIINHEINNIEKDAKGFQALIDQALIKIMSNIERRSLTGVLAFQNRTQSQAVFFQKGRLVHAFHGKVIGQKALFRIFRDQGGFSNFIQQQIPLLYTIKKPLIELLQEGVKEIQKLQQVNKNFFSERLTVNDQNLKNFSNSKVISELRSFISLVQQHNQIGEIIEHSQLTDSRTYDRLNYLLSIGILEMKEKK